MKERDKTRDPVAGFFAELKRRRVLQIGGAYIAGAWLGAEILAFLFEQFLAPDWTYRFVAIVLVVGFPLTMVLAWVVQLQEDGSWALDSERGDHRTLAAAIALGLLVTAGLSWLLVPEREPEAAYQPLPNSLAVVPSGDAGDLYRSLIAGLEQSRKLTLVRPDPSELPGDLYKYGRSLGVAYLASGGINVQLLDVANEKVAWSQSFENDAQQVVATSNAIANGLLEAMSLPSLSREEFTGTNNILAYETYLSGRLKAAELDDDALRTAIDKFQKAINLDRGYVRAYIGLAEALYELRDGGALPTEQQQTLDSRAAAAAEMAQKLDRHSGAAISLLGLTSANRQVRIQAFERAIELDPDHHPSYYRYALQMKEDGNVEDAARLMQRALVLCPDNELYRDELAVILDLRDGVLVRK